MTVVRIVLCCIWDKGNAEFRNITSVWNHMDIYQKIMGYDFIYVHNTQNEDVYVIWNHKTLKMSQKQSILYFFVCLAFWFDIWHNLWKEIVNKTFLKLGRDFAWAEVRAGRSGQFLLNQSSFPSFTEIQFLKLLPSKAGSF